MVIVPEALLASRCSYPCRYLQVSACRQCVPLGKSCTLSLTEYNSSNGLVGHLEPPGNVSFFAGNALHLLLSVRVIHVRGAQRSYS